MNPHPDTGERLLAFGSLLLLALAFVTGGDSINRGWGDVATQWLALPVLLMAAGALTRAPMPRANAVLLAIAVLGPLVVAAQLALGATVTPWATERALLAWIPPVATFLACAALPPASQRTGLMLLAALATGNLVLASLQLAAPQDSALNLYPQWAPNFNGVFANVNHQATALAIAAVLLLSRLADGARSDGRPRDGRALAASLAFGGLAVLLLIALPLTRSRGMVLIAAAALLALPLVNGWLAGQARKYHGGLRVAAISAAGLAAFALVGLSTYGWMQVDRLEEGRAEMASVTARLAWDAMPFGTGAGSFVRWFEANLPAHMLREQYYNHAHNEYVQWWLEGGIAGLAWIALLLAGFAWTFPRRGRNGKRPDWAWVGAWLGAGCLLAHSVVDYPMRTPALAVAGAWMAAVAVTATLRHRRSRSGNRSRSRRTVSPPGPDLPVANRHAASQRA